MQMLAASVCITAFMDIGIINGIFPLSPKTDIIFKRIRIDRGERPVRNTLFRLRIIPLSRTSLLSFLHCIARLSFEIHGIYLISYGLKGYG